VLVLGAVAGFCVGTVLISEGLEMRELGVGWLLREEEKRRELEIELKSGSGSGLGLVRSFS
jgi:hypothetical protein